MSDLNLGSPVVRVAKTTLPRQDYYRPEAVAELLEELLSMDRDGESLRAVIRPGDRVTIKPNWVAHVNRSGAGMECLVTHWSVVKAAIDWALRAGARQVIVGDAPIQGCDWSQLMSAGGFGQLREAYAIEPRVKWRDFRRSVLGNMKGVWNRQTDVRPIEDYVLFDLGGESLLEPISRDSRKFRVTMYNPDLMRKTHAPGRHQYLVAKEVIDTDVVVNLPKLKTHKKAGVTGALKNLVGINGNKDYLPHHRLGGSRTGGDCYQGGNPLKLVSEWLLDGSNKREGVPAYLLRQASRVSFTAARALGGDRNLEGSWHGNDTVWRMCLDLNRVLVYGRMDASLAPTPQRRIITITDALVCGQGDGPLSPIPRDLGMLTIATNAAAAEYVHAHLMGFDWSKIHIIREAFGTFSHPLVNFPAEGVAMRLNGRDLARPWPRQPGGSFVPPTGWAGRCELPATHL